MNAKIFSIIAFLLIFSCKKKVENSKSSEILPISSLVELSESPEMVKLRSGKHQYQFSKKKLPFQNVVLLNASLIGYISELELENKMVGVSSPEYIYSEKILKAIKEGKIQNIGNEQKYDIERIISLKPDAVFTNYIASFENTYEILEKNNIEVIFLDEYLEQQPLEKSAYLKVFGKLFGVEEKAHSKYESIKKNYEYFKKLASNKVEKPIVLANEMYGNQWFLPGGKTQLAYFIKDAGGNYLMKQNTDTKAVPLSFEEVFKKAENAKIWVNIGNHKQKNELLTINPNYAKMKVFQNGKLYSLTGKEKGKANDFFESGVVRADLVLKDYIKMLHPDLFPHEPLNYMSELK